MRELLNTLCDGHRLSEEQAHALAAAWLSDQTTDSQLAASLVAVSAGPAPNQALAASALQSACGWQADEGVVRLAAASEIEGLLGSLVLASAGTPTLWVAGPRRELLEELGVESDPEAADTAAWLEELGVAIPPGSELALERLSAIAGELGLSRAWERLRLLGALAKGRRAVLAAKDRFEAASLLDAAFELGYERVLVCLGEGLLAGVVSRIIEQDGNRRWEYRINPDQMGLGRYPVPAPVAKERLRAVREVLEGRLGARRDQALLQAAAAMRVAGVCSDWSAGIGRGRALLDGGQPARLLEQWAERSAEGEQVA